MKPRVISFHYTLTDKAGKTLDTSRGSDPLAFLEGSGHIIPGLETALKSLKKGDKKNIFVPSEEAYGKRNENLVIKVPVEEFPKSENIKVGQQYRSESPDGHAQMFTVTHVNKSEVTLDGNHPLADHDLNFDVEIMEVREATKEEMTHGHVHGPGGHHHH